MTLSTSVAPVTPPPPLSSLSVHDNGFQLIRAAETLLKSLLRGQTITSPMLREAMTEAFGVSDSSGAWSWKLAYDALEAAQVMFLRKYLPGMKASAKTPAQLLAMLQKIAALAPTHTRRSEESVELQQFSTPLELALLVGQAAAITPTDVVLEPSAGTGLLAVHADVTGAWVALNELADTRARMLQLLFPGAPVTRFNAEHIHDRLPTDLGPSVVLMNPPFSASPKVTGTHAGVDLRHLRSALARLAPGGRLVAITSFGLNPSNAEYTEAFRALAKTTTLVFTAGLSGDFFKRHGTTIETRMLVFDKTPEPLGHIPARALCATPLELANAISREIPPRLPVTPRFTAPLHARADGNVGAASVRGTSESMTAAQPRPLSNPAAVSNDAARGFSPAAAAPSGIELHYEIIGHPAPRASSDALYEPYAPERIRIPGAKPHPDKLVQSAAMASVLPPVPTYRPHVIPGLVEDGILSDAQLETVIYAGQAHDEHLSGHWRIDPETFRLAAAEHDHPDAIRYRRGFFIGDGTGAGKGRQIAGIILDNWLKGRRRAVWISRSELLIEDAQRDWSALKQEKLLVVPQSRYKPNKPITLSEGVLFSTFATIRSESDDHEQRVMQLVKWLGADFDGVIVFDESHAMGNAAPGRSERGEQRASQQGMKGLQLQRMLPNARVVYVSATGATVIENLAYAERLGLWGSDELPFHTRSAFVTAMHEGGVAAAEVLARDLKALGLYVSRALSYEGVEVEMLDHPLTPEQIKIYDAYARAYQVIHTNLLAALKASNVTDESGEAMNSRARTAAMAAFESNKQRFFNHLITAMKVPTLLKAMRDDLDAGRAAVVQIVSTSEALMDRRLADIPPGEWNDLSVDVTPREYVLDYLKHSFPTQLMEIYTDDEGREGSRPVMDDSGNPVECREAVQRRDEMMEYLGALPPVQAALDQLIHHFGADVIAEVTGRARRIVKKRTIHGDVLAVENRPGSANSGDTQAFMDDKKRALVFSDAGGTGRSYHSDKGSLNQRKRVHYLLEAGWKADTAIQGLGRTHRTNQASPPLFRPVATDVRGEKRFLSTIARRLDSLGAITRGERKTGGQGMFRATDNLENSYARDALQHLYQLIARGKIDCCSYQRFVEATGLELKTKAGAMLAELPPITRFLNRVLALEISLQNQLFEIFEGMIATRVESAIAAGTYEVGLETIRAERLEIVGRGAIPTPMSTIAETQVLDVKRLDRNQPLLLDRVLARSREEGAVLLANVRSNRAALQLPHSTIILEDGSVQARVKLIRPMEAQAVAVRDMEESSWDPCDVETFSRLWQHQVDAVPEYSESRFHIVTGLMLPIWKQLPFGNPRVYRFTTTDTGERIIGRLVPPECPHTFATPVGPPLSANETWQRVLSGAPVHLQGGMRLKKVLAMHEHRVELEGFDADALPRLKAIGLYTEIINHKTRLFLRMTEQGPQTLERLLSRHPAAQAAAA